jgi:hypothetical protein
MHESCTDFLDINLIFLDMYIDILLLCVDPSGSCMNLVRIFLILTSKREENFLLLDTHQEIMKNFRETKWIHIQICE